MGIESAHRLSLWNNGLVLAAFGHRDFRFLWAGQLLSSFGSWLLLVAVPYRVFELTGSPLASGLTLVAALPGTVLSPVAGLLVDRWDRRVTMLAVDLGRAAAILPLLCFHRPDQLWIVYAALVAESLLGQLFDPAAQALVPALVGRGRDLASANALMSVIAAVSRLAGASLGGVALLAWGMETVVWLDSGTYVASALSLLLLRWRPGAAVRTKRSGSTPGVLVELVAGLRHLLASRPLRGLLLVTAVFVAANGAFTALLVPDVGLRLHATAEALGLILAATGAGFLLGAPLGRALLHRVGLRTTATLSLLVTGVSFLAWFDTDRLAVALLFAAVAGAAAVTFLVARRTQVQVLTRDSLLGRAGAAFLGCEAAATLAGTAVGGAAVGLAGLQAAVAGAGALMLASAGLAALLLGDEAPWIGP
jgi:predicted MFS family arabinose efflux permease